MSLLRQVAHNTALQFAGKIIGTALGFGAAIFLLSYLHDEKFGNYTTAMTYLQLFGIVMDLGLYVVLLKHISDPENAQGKITNNIFTFRLVTAIFFLLLACASVWFVPVYPLIVKLSVLVVAINFLFITLNQLLLAIYQQHLAMGRVAVAEVLGKIVMFLGTVLVVFVFKGGVLMVMLTVVVSGALNFILLWIWLRRYTRLHFAFDMTLWRGVLKESWPIAIAIALNLIYFKSDGIILSLYKSQADVGIYAAPYKMLEVIITLPAMVVGLIMPVLSKYYSANDHARFKELYQRSIDLLLMIALPLVIGTMFVAEPIMLLIASKQFTAQPSVLGDLLRILIIAVGMIFIGTLTGYVVVVINKQKEIIFGYAFVAVTALVGYLWFIPRYSYYGAAWVTVYSETTMVLIALILIYRTTKVWPNLRLIPRILFACVAMGAVLWALQGYPVLASIATGSIVYVLVLVGIGGVTPAELKTVLQSRKRHVEDLNS